MQVAIILPSESSSELSGFLSASGGTVGARRCEDRSRHRRRARMPNVMPTRTDTARVMTRDRLSKAVETIRTTPGLTAQKVCIAIGLKSSQAQHLKEALTYFDAHIYTDGAATERMYYDEGQRS